LLPIAYAMSMSDKNQKNVIQLSSYKKLRKTH